MIVDIDSKGFILPSGLVVLYTTYIVSDLKEVQAMIEQFMSERHLKLDLTGFRGSYMQGLQLNERYRGRLRPSDNYKIQFEFMYLKERKNETI